MSQIESGLPASSDNTWFSEFSLSRFAKTHPAEPPPTMMKSYVLFMRSHFFTKRIIGADSIKSEFIENNLVKIR